MVFCISPGFRLAFVDQVELNRARGGTDNALIPGPVLLDEKLNIHNSGSGLSG